MQSSRPLNDVFQDFKKLETGYMDTVLECITDRANTLVQREQEAKLVLLQPPVYPYPPSYAHELGSWSSTGYLTKQILPAGRPLVTP